MKRMQSFLSVLLLTGIMGVSATPIGAQEGVLFKARAGETNYCHMKFPAIREETLYLDRPVLKDPSTTDIVDYYGACSYDPLDKVEIQRQRSQAWRVLQGGD